MSNRDKLRSAAFKSPPSKKINIKYNGVDFELRQPNMRVRKDILRKSADEKGQPTMIDMVEWVAIYCTYVPGTDDLVFEETDHDSFENMGMDGFLDKVTPVIPELLNLAEQPGEEKGD